MATVESWGGTIADIGPMYPMVGTEGLLVIIGLALWIVWHVIQANRENREYEDQIRKYGREGIAQAVHCGRGSEEPVAGQPVAG